MKKKWKKRIKQVLDETDFDDWADKMRAMGWKTWDGSAMSYPSGFELYEQAEDYLERVVRDKLLFMSSGSITAIRTKYRLILLMGSITISEDL